MIEHLKYYNTITKLFCFPQSFLSIFKRTNTLIFLFLLSACNSKEPELEGSYTLIAAKYNDSNFVKEDTTKRKTVKVIRNGYWIASTFSGKKVIVEMAVGGTYKIKNHRYIETINFSSQDESLIGRTYEYAFKLHNGNYTFNKIISIDECDDCSTGEEYYKTESDNKLKDDFLEGVWKLQTQEWFGKKIEDSDLTLCKIYIYPRFAWASYHNKGKDFIGTAGGTYQLDGNKLVEHVEYFSYYVQEPYDFPASIKRFSADSLLQVSMDGAGKEIYIKTKVNSK
jgi:hypothetical protein